jgi:hypothetical protein
MSEARKKTEMHKVWAEDLGRKMPRGRPRHR